MLIRVSVFAVLLFGGFAVFGQSVISNINTLSPWQTCSACAGSGSVSHSASYGISSPSLSGNAAKFHIGSGSYKDALWWRQLGPRGTATHFVYDLYFYLKNPSAAQALEFDANQSVGGHKYIFGTECDIGNGHVWRTWSARSSWVSSGVGCPTPKSYAWNHLTLEFQRYNGMVKFISVTLNGNKSYFNKSYAPEGSSVQELNVAFQMDENGSGTSFDTYLDKVKLTYW